MKSLKKYIQEANNRPWFKPSRIYDDIRDLRKSFSQDEYDLAQKEGIFKYFVSKNFSFEDMEKYMDAWLYVDEDDIQRNKTINQLNKKYR